MIVIGITCKDCKREVKDIPEYQAMAKDENMEVNTWVAANDNLYEKSTHTVICAECYVKGLIAGRYS